MFGDSAGAEGEDEVKLEVDVDVEAAADADCDETDVDTVSDAALFATALEPFEARRLSGMTN